MSPDKTIVDQVDKQRKQLGFLTIEETLELARQGNVILDPWALLISRNARLGKNNVFYPNVVIHADNDGDVKIGDANTFYPMAYLEARQGTISIGCNNQFGEGGVSIKANRSGNHIEIEKNGRYLSGAVVVGNSILGSGTQVLGAVTVENCTLMGGQSFNDPDPDLRGAVVKGNGLIRDLSLRVGDVVVANGLPPSFVLQRQSELHPGKVRNP